jgi:hypothetical protein
MIKRAFSLLLLLSSGLASAAQLTDMETRWLTAGAAVLSYAKQELRLPIDITVQPQARPTDVPLALGYQDGRCKLVLSMRGNPTAEDILDGVPTAQRALMIEAMIAHEIGHCWRYAQGAWHAVPAGFEQGPDGEAAALRPGPSSATPKNMPPWPPGCVRCVNHRRPPARTARWPGCNWRPPGPPSPRRCRCSSRLRNCGAKACCRTTEP